MQAWSAGQDKRDITAASVPASPFSAQLRAPTSWASAAELSINVACLQVTVCSTITFNARLLLLTVMLAFQPANETRECSACTCFVRAIWHF